MGDGSAPRLESMADGSLWTPQISAEQSHCYSITVAGQGAWTPVYNSFGSIAFGLLALN